MEFLYKLNNVYTPLDRRTITGPILKDAYLNIKEKVMNILNLSALLNFVSDESESSNGDRVANLSVNIPRAGSFHIISECTKAMTHDAEHLSAWIIEHINTVVGGHFERVNLICTDTCSTMRSVHTILSQDLRL